MQGTLLALKNALRYFPPHTHEELLPEFAAELRDFGHIYMYRFLPTFPVRAYPVSQLPARCPQAAAIMLMVLNNLDPAVAQYPEELVTYGGGGQVFSNWAQFWLTMSYLAEMDEEQTLVLYSGHPMGLFPSSADAPRAVITNGMVVPHYSSANEYDDMFALGVTMYGQMTAGSFCYIGPQGIVHGTTITLLGAGRRYLGSGDLAGRVFVTSGLGGMSGAQAKAAELVHESLRRQAAAVNALAAAGMRFWDYGNAFLLQASRAGADVLAEGSPAAADAQRPPEFRYPSYVQDVMGDVFSLGFGPFRWVCTSGLAADLEATDRLAERTLQAIADSGELSADAKAQ
ncbi:Urocanate hydratase [Gryllus bimaculatus]|nr:Urocanate hydratase [Gryllus bimaculatus]